MFLDNLLSNLCRVRATGEVRAAYDEFLQRLDPAQAAAQALKPGERIPEFLLPVDRGSDGLTSIVFCLCRLPCRPLFRPHSRSPAWCRPSRMSL
jgi:hypothetical protein